MKVYIEKTVDYTLKRRGDRWFTIVDENKQYVNMSGGYWKTLKACKERVAELGHELVGVYTVHQNYSHWADFEFAK